MSDGVPSGVVECQGPQRCAVQQDRLRRPGVRQAAPVGVSAAHTSQTILARTPWLGLDRGVGVEEAATRDLQRARWAADDRQMGMAHGAQDPPAQRFARVADRLEGKASWARQRARNHAAGDVGELRVREAVVPLVETGWAALHNRARRHGGNIDHVLVGPSGVYVLDSKRWTGPVTFDGPVVRSKGHNCRADLQAVAEQAAEVGEVLPFVRVRRRGRGWLGPHRRGSWPVGPDPGRVCHGLWRVGARGQRRQAASRSDIR